MTKRKYIKLKKQCWPAYDLRLATNVIETFHSFQMYFIPYHFMVKVKS